MSLLSPQLQAFVSVSKHRTVHAAARELALTQTGVTQRIRTLENALSTTLFTRSRRGMMLTAEGKSLLRYCQAAQDLEGEALARIQTAGRASEVRLCLTGPTSLIESRLTAQCLPAMRAFPHVLVTFKVNDVENREEDLRNGTAQLAILPRHSVPNEMEGKVLAPEEYVLVGTRAWKKRSLREIVRTERIIDFDPTDRMTRSYLAKLKLLPEARPERHFVNDNAALVRLFHEGLGYGVLTKEVAKPYLKQGNLIVLAPESTFRNELSLAWFPRPDMPAYFKAFVDAIK